MEKSNRIHCSPILMRPEQNWISKVTEKKMEVKTDPAVRVACCPTSGPEFFKFSLTGRKWAGHKKGALAQAEQRPVDINPLRATGPHCNLSLSSWILFTANYVHLDILMTCKCTTLAQPFIHNTEASAALPYRAFWSSWVQHSCAPRESSLTIWLSRYNHIHVTTAEDVVTPVFLLILYLNGASVTSWPYVTRTQSFRE